MIPPAAIQLSTWFVHNSTTFAAVILTPLFHIHAQDFETKKAAGAATLGPFDQRPYFRLLLSLLEDMNRPDRLLDNTNLQVLIGEKEKGLSTSLQRRHR